MVDLKVVSLNTRGMRNGIKRRKLFRFVKVRHKADVVLFQETHCDNKVEEIWSNEFGNKIIFANGESNARGVAIALNKKVANDVTEIIRDINGRYLIISVKINGLLYCIANIYAPNEDNPEWFENIFNLIRSLNSVGIILGGDFNVVRDSTLDRFSNINYNPLSKKVIDNSMEEFNLRDIWRNMNPEKKMLTWMSGKNTNNWSRMDYFLITQSVKCIKSTIEPSICTDHSLISIVVTTSDTKRGPGIWKFNNELLGIEQYCEEMEMVLQGITRIYDYLNEEDLWELLKFEGARFSKEYAKNRAQKEQDERFNLYRTLEVLQEEYTKQTPPDEQIRDGIEEIKIDLDAYETRDAKRAAFRCKQKWIQAGELPSKYYFNLEKRNNISKSMYMLKKQDGTLTKDYREMLNIQVDFYSGLYASDPNVHFDLVNSGDIILPTNLKQKMEEEMSMAELYDAMMTLKNNKTPGGDGLTIEYYRKFWKVLCKPLHAMYLKAVRNGKLNPSGRRGVINLIPKKSSCELELKGWRAISLLNYDYKIWSKAIANRLEEATFLINKSQNGFIKGRSIFSNIMRTAETVRYLKETNQPGLVVVVDYEKCFDRIEHESIKGTFEYFGFGPNFIQMMHLLFSGIEQHTMCNGYSSKYFDKNRGINQGCCASPMIYSYCGEIMSHLIHSNEKIQGISVVEHIKNILSQFADDTSVFLKFEQLIMDEFINVMSRVENLMGLKVSYEKTTIYRVGSLRDSEAELYTQKNFKWSNEAIETLGLSISNDGTPSSDNYDRVLNKLECVCNKWENRTATLFGKVLLVNTLMGSLFVYSMSTMLSLTKEQIKIIEKRITRFIWNDKRPKIALSTLQKLKYQGGVRLVNLNAKQKALKISWIFRLDSDAFIAECAYKALSSTLRNLIWRCNLKKVHCRTIIKNDSFWRQMLEAWAEINYHEVLTVNQVVNELIWGNSKITREGLPIIWKKWIERDILFVKDILREDLSFKNNVELRVNWLEYNALISAIPHEWKLMLKLSENLASCEAIEKSLYDKLSSNKTVSRTVYEILINDDNAMQKYIHRWSDRGLDLNVAKFYEAFKRLYQCTRITKYRDFQYRFLLGKIICNIDLKEWGLKESDTCTFCEEDQESMVHLFWECKYVLPLWRYLKYLCDSNNIVCEVDAFAMLYNSVHNSGTHVVNFIVIFILQYIYRTQCKGIRPRVETLENELELHHKIEYANAKLSNKLNRHIVKWNPIINFNEE